MVALRAVLMQQSKIISFFCNFIMRTKFNLFDHTYKLNLRTHKSPINLDTQGSTAVLQISVDLPLYRCTVIRLIVVKIFSYAENVRNYFT